MTGRVAAVDFGSNTVGYLVAEPDGTILEREAQFVRLGQGVRVHRRLAPEAIERTLDWVAEIARRFEKWGVQRTRAVATEAVRLSRNRDELLAPAGRTLGTKVEVVSGEEEGLLTFQGVRLGYPQGPLVVLDIGGGSSEVSFGAGGRADQVSAVSLGMGAVTLTEKHGEDRLALASAAREIVPAVPILERDPGVLTVIGGTGANAAMMDLGMTELEDDRVEGHELTRDQLHRLVDRAAALSPEERVTQLGVPTKRADVLIAGFVILDEVLERLGLARIRASRYSLRHGILRGLLEPSVS